MIQQHAAAPSLSLLGWVEAWKGRDGMESVFWSRRQMCRGWVGAGRRLCKEALRRIGLSSGAFDWHFCISHFA